MQKEAVMELDNFYMKNAIELAQKGSGKVNPNPLVGAVITKNDRIIGQGYHEKYGELHAERNAFMDCMEDPKDSTLYVTLEPCVHQGKTPPCVDAIIEHKVKRVVIGSLDPNPLVNGKGIEIMRKKGIIVETGVLEKECKYLNQVFFHYIRRKLPFVVMKYGMTADGKIATKAGESRWITGESSRNHVHITRNHLSAIMVGIGTAIKDNPLLTCRLVDGRNPIRIICDDQLRLPMESHLVKTAKNISTIIATISQNTKRQSLYEELGVKVICVKEKKGRIDLNDLMLQLGKRGIDSILLEGGGTLNYAALESGIVNKLQIYIAPKIFGGEKSLTGIEGLGISSIENAFQLKNCMATMMDKDIMLEYDVEEKFCLQE
jgi:diaminohydroxyphosphoribosylaminopyrimidine deaminase / 5-amino-6-(5-phosphoribosylamino)uracil reductase